MANFNIAYLIELKDRFTTVAKKVAQNNKLMQKSFDGVSRAVRVANVVLWKTGKSLKSFGNGAKNLGGSLKGLGNELKGASVAIGGLFWKSLSNWQKQASAIASLDNNLKTRARSLGMTSEQVQKMASEMQAKSVFGDEDIIQNVTNQLLTFDKVNGDVFKRANQSVLDMTSKIYGANATAEQMRPIALAVGKALNNPAEAMNSLGRVGVKFTAEQQKAVKQLVATGRSAKAQEFIMRSLEQRYKGSAETLGNTQPIKQLTNAFNDMLEPLGQIVQEFLVPIIKTATKMIAIFNGFNKPFKTVIVTIMGLVAIASPLLMVLGGIITAVGTLTTAMAGLNIAFMANPITWVVLGVVALIAVLVVLYKKVEWFRNLINFIGLILKSIVTVVRLVIASVKQWASEHSEVLENIKNGILTVIKIFGSIIGWIVKISAFILAMTNPVTAVIAVVVALGAKFNWLGSIIKSVSGFLDKFNADAEQKINVKKESVIKAEDAKNKNSVDVNGKIVVSAEKGSKVQKTSSKAQSKAKGNVGFNLAKAGA